MPDCLVPYFSCSRDSLVAQVRRDSSERYISGPSETHDDVLWYFPSALSAICLGDRTLDPLFNRRMVEMGGRVAHVPILRCGRVAPIRVTFPNHNEGGPGSRVAPVSGCKFPKKGGCPRSLAIGDRGYHGPKQARTGGPHLTSHKFGCWEASNPNRPPIRPKDSQCHALRE